jgi:hypothetical protein
MLYWCWKTREATVSTVFVIVSSRERASADSSVRTFVRSLFTLTYVHVWRHIDVIMKISSNPITNGSSCKIGTSDSCRHGELTYQPWWCLLLWTHLSTSTSGFLVGSGAQLESFLASSDLELAKTPCQDAKGEYGSNTSAVALFQECVFSYKRENGWRCCYRSV